MSNRSVKVKGRDSEASGKSFKCSRRDFKLRNTLNNRLELHLYPRKSPSMEINFSVMRLKRIMSFFQYRKHLIVERERIVSEFIEVLFHLEIQSFQADMLCSKI